MVKRHNVYLILTYYAHFNISCMMNRLSFYLNWKIKHHMTCILIVIHELSYKMPLPSPKSSNIIDPVLIWPCWSLILLISDPTFSLPGGHARVIPGPVPEQESSSGNHHGRESGSRLQPDTKQPTSLHILSISRFIHHALSWSYSCCRFGIWKWEVQPARPKYHQAPSYCWCKLWGFLVGE